MSAHGIELVDEHDRRGMLAGRLEQPPDSRGAHAHEHLHERGRRLREEGGPGLMRYGLGQQCLSGARRAVEEDSLGYVGPDVPEALGITQVVHNLAELVLGLVGAGDVPPGDRRSRVGLDLLGPRARHEAHEHEHAHHQQPHEDDR